MQFNEAVTYKVIKNQDKEYVKDLKKRIKANNGYCPCQQEKTADTKCPCKIFKETSECCCGLYIKVPVYEDE